MSQFVEFLKNLTAKELENVHLGFGAEVLSFNTSTLRANIRPRLKKSIPGGSMDYPDLINVPCSAIKSGGAYIRPQYEVGDLVYASVGTAQIREQLKSSRRQADSIDRFGLGNAIVTGAAIPTDFEAPPDFSEDKGFLIASNGSSINIQEDKIKFKVGETTMVFNKDGLCISIGDTEFNFSSTDLAFMSSTGLISLLMHTHTSATPGQPTTAPIPT